MTSSRPPLAALVALAAVAACGDSGATSDAGAPDAPPQVCVLPPGPAPEFARDLGCVADYEALASRPIVASIPGARSVKTVIDRADDEALYFQNSVTYPIHWDFASAHLSGQAGLPIVPPLGQFNQTEYYSPDRRFVLGALTHYAGPDAWVYEIAPYDTAGPEMILAAFAAIRAHAPFATRLRFHPTSSAIDAAIVGHEVELDVISTDEIFAGIDYQPLTLAQSLGKLRFVRAIDLPTTYLDFRDIVVLDRVPNDLTTVMGSITAEFQTPLAHINVLAQNRGTPNMGLRGAMTDPRLVALDGQWIRLEVGADDWSAVQVTRAEADAWWEDHRPAVIEVPRLDTTFAGLHDVETLIDPELPLLDAIRALIPIFGGKASHYAALALVPGVPVPKAFVVPVHYYWTFMEQHGFLAQIDAMLADPAFEDDPATRDARLAALRAAIMAAPVDPAFEALLGAKIAAEYPGLPMRFRSSTNAEDLEGFTGAGLYTSKTGIPGDPAKPVLDAVREVWASVWFFRAFEERRYRGIDHRAVGMALLVHNSFPDEYATGVAITANIFDTRGVEPGFYVNVQRGDVSVVLPEAGVTTDQFIYAYDLPGQPVIYYGHSNQVPAGETVLTPAQIHELGDALSAIQAHFRPAYGPTVEDPTRFYGMDVEFKFDEDALGVPRVIVKQARPHTGRGE